MKGALFVIVVGSSGVGKSTLLGAAVGADWPLGLKVQIPRKHSTRMSRGFEEQVELEHIDRSTFERNKASEEYLVTYESYGEMYGFPRTSFPEQPNMDTVLLQAAPTAVAHQLLQVLGSRYAVRICALEAPSEVVLQRLTARSDEETAVSLDRRSKTLDGKRVRSADFTINANVKADIVFATFRAWVIEQWQVFNASRLRG